MDRARAGGLRSRDPLLTIMRRPFLLALSLTLAALLAGPADAQAPSPGDEAAPALAPRRRRVRRPRVRPVTPDVLPAPSSSPPSPPSPPSVHLAMGTPTDADPSDDWLLQRPQYALSYNRARLGPNWVSWALDASHFGGVPRHKGRFFTDESLPAGWYRVQHADYTGTAFDRGHLVRSEERTRSREDNASTFFMTNILPQRHELNGGPWLRFEELCQTLAQQGKKGLFITAGPVYGERPETIGPGVAVPLAFYKIVVVLAPGQGAADVTSGTRVIAVLMPNTASSREEPWWRYRVSVAELEQKSGYRFLGAVSEPARAALIRRVDAGPVG